jgi:hypothetical protein
MMQALEETRARRDKEDKNYADLGLKLADKNLSEDQQDLLYKTAKNNQRSFGKHDIDALFKAVSRPAKPGEVVQPATNAMTTAANRMNQTKSMRVGIERPQGTGEELKEAADLEKSKVDTARVQADTAKIEGETAKSAVELRRERAASLTDIMANYTNADTKKPATRNDAIALLDTPDTAPSLIPRSPEMKAAHNLAEAFGQDPNTPEGRVAVSYARNAMLENDLGPKKIQAEIDELNRRGELIRAQIAALSEETGVDPVKLSTIGENFSAAFARTVGGTQIANLSSTVSGVLPVARGLITMQWDEVFSNGDKKDELTELMFGSPETVEADLDAKLGAKVRTVTLFVPTKGGTPESKVLSRDDAVTFLKDIRERTSAELVPQFNALRQIDLLTAKQLIAMNPTMRVAAKYLAPDLLAPIQDAIDKTKEANDKVNDDPLGFKSLGKKLAKEKAKRQGGVTLIPAH